jgi:hypothetical protein
MICSRTSIWLICGCPARLILCVWLTGFHRVQANKRISCHRLLTDSFVSRNLRGLLERGIQESMDREECHDKLVEVAIGYAGSVGTSLWSEIREDRALVGPGYGVVVVDWLTMDL